MVVPVGTMVVPVGTMGLMGTMGTVVLWRYYGSTHGYYGTIGYYRVLRVLRYYKRVLCSTRGYYGSTPNGVLQGTTSIHCRGNEQG